MPSIETIRTADLFLVAFLSLRGHEIISAQKNSEGKSEFIFKRTKEAEEDKTLFFADEEILIRLRSYGKKYRDLKFIAFNPALAQQVK